MPDYDLNFLNISITGLFKTWTTLHFSMRKVKDFFHRCSNMLENPNFNDPQLQPLNKAVQFGCVWPELKKWKTNKNTNEKHLKMLIFYFLKNIRFNWSVWIWNHQRCYSLPVLKWLAWVLWSNIYHFDTFGLEDQTFKDIPVSYLYHTQQIWWDGWTMSCFVSTKSS